MSPGTIRSRSSIQSQEAVGLGDRRSFWQDLPALVCPPFSILSGTSLSDSANLFQQLASACYSSCSPNVGHPFPDEARYFWGCEGVLWLEVCLWAKGQGARKGWVLDPNLPKGHFYDAHRGRANSLGSTGTAPIPHPQAWGTLFSSHFSRDTGVNSALLPWKMTPVHLPCGNLPDLLRTGDIIQVWGRGIRTCSRPLSPLMGACWSTPRLTTGVTLRSGRGE